jgi:hypothetical protein
LAVFDRGLNQGIPGEPAPHFQLRANALVVGYNRDEIARTTALQRSDQLRQEPGRKRLASGVQIKNSLHRP